MKRPALARLLRTLHRTLLGAGMLLGALPVLAQSGNGPANPVRYTDANGLSHTHVEAAAGGDAPAGTIIYRYTDAEGAVHVYADTLANPERLMASSASSLNHHGNRDASDTAADPPFVRTMLAHPDAARYDPLLTRTASEFGLDAALLKAVLTAESGFNARAVSSKGAIGLMQILPETAQRYGLQGDRRKSLQQKLTDPAINIRLAARYLRDLMAMFPQHVELAIASYNAGEGAVQKYGNRIPPYPETQGYVRLVSRFYQLYRPAPVAAVASNDSGNAGARARLKVTLPARAPAPLND